MVLQKELVDILACPVCKTALKYTNAQLNCTKCKKKYQIRESIPILLP